MMRAKSASMFPEGRIPMSIIIFDIALAFSARNKDSSGEDDRNGARQIADRYSASERGALEQAANETAIAINPQAKRTRFE